MYNHAALVSYNECSYGPPEHPSPTVGKGRDILALGSTVFDMETGVRPMLRRDQRIGRGTWRTRGIL